MPTLLKKPVLFVVIYLGLAALAVYPTIYGIPFSSYLAIAGVILSFVLQFYWTFWALRISSNAGHGGDAYVKRFTLATIGAVVLTLVVVMYKIFVVHGSIGDGSIAVAGRILTMLAALFWFSIFWFAAQSLCNAEQQRELPAAYIIGTFLLYVYLAVGAFFLSARLKKLIRQGAS